MSRSPERAVRMATAASSVNVEDTVVSHVRVHAYPRGGRVPRRGDHDERRRELTAALLRIASTRGLQAVSMREVAAEAGVSLRVVQYYFADKRALMASGLTELAGRLDRRVRERAAAIGSGLPPRTVLEVVLGAILPKDDDSRADQLAWT